METARELFADRPQPVSPAGVLARIREARQVEDAAAAEVLVQAVAWAHAHPAPEEEACTFVSGGTDTGLTIAGPGAPTVSEFAVVELATALGLSDAAGRNLVGQALELVHRLPRLWARVTAGDLAPWRARRIAEQTTVLSPEAAAYVDVNVAPFAHKLGPAATERLVDEAIARFMPELAEERREQAAEQRHFTIEHQQVSFEGTSRVHGELDLADALDLDAAVSHGAEQLAALGCDASLDVRRAKAVGEIARTQLGLDLIPLPEPGEGSARPSLAEPVEGSARPSFPEPVEGRSPRPSLPEPVEGPARPSLPEPAEGRSPRRQVTLYIHLSEDAVRGADGAHLARVENRGPHLVTADTIREWLGVDGTQVRVQPVIDLNDRLCSRSHELPARMREQAVLRDHTCVFPHCTRPARTIADQPGCDDEHAVSWDAGGPTASDNIAKVCRKHHRAKTHGGWSYRIIRPGTYEWTSPHGYRYLRDPSGTVDLNPLALAAPHPVEEWDDLPDSADP